ncbi:MAG: TonB-dependent receptor [Prevotellaceae bacterium]|jgi:iron complex outermembrane receptor protein|nr:TonB-dependent receptor [Prevotellaceae bacterium]
MREDKQNRRLPFRWKHFNRKAYAVFVSVTTGKHFSIGVLMVATLTFANTECVSAQNLPPEQMQVYELEEVEVSGTRTPLTEMEAARMVTVLSQAEIQAAAAHSINDLLEYAIGVDIRQRGELGVQSDISIHGGTFDQITILLNGVNITNPHTGHLTANFPVLMDDIERIEVLEGPAARVFGTSAFTGAINIVTKNERQSHVAVDAVSGAYGLGGAHARINYSNEKFTHRLSGGYDRTDGATINSDFRSGKAYYQGKFASSQADVRWQMSVSDQAFGANTFYSAQNPNQYEAVGQLRLSLQAETKGWLRFLPTIYWNRTNDHYQWIRGTHTGENFHLTDVYGANLNAYFHSRLGKTSFGAELRNEGILSSSLGKPLPESQYVPVSGEDDVYYKRKDNRTSVNYYLEHNILLPKLTISMGVMANLNTFLDHRFRLYPGIDVSFRPHLEWKLFASWNTALRLPTFTELYYNTGNIEGNVDLRPEKMQAFILGAQYRTERIHARISGFYHKGSRLIDWVKYSPEDNYHSNNFDLDNMGVETSVAYQFRTVDTPHFPIEKISVGYTYIYQHRRDGQPYYRSNYAGEYLRHKMVARIEHRVWRRLTANWAFRWQKRMGAYEVFEQLNGHYQSAGLRPYPAYGLVDLKLLWTARRYTVFAEANNLLDTHYFDFGSIPQPGLWVKGGFSYRFDF